MFERDVDKSVGNILAWVETSSVNKHVILYWDESNGWTDGAGGFYKTKEIIEWDAVFPAPQKKKSKLRQQFDVVTAQLKSDDITDLLGMMVDKLEALDE